MYTDLGIVDDDFGIQTHVTVLTATEHRTVDTRTIVIRRSHHIFTDGDIGLVCIAHEEVAAITETWVDVDGCKRQTS